MSHFISLERTPQESLLQLKDIIIAAASESDYNSIAKDYKKQPFENEHNQVIRWATLMREHFNQKQNSHGHHSAEKSKPTKIRPSTASKSRFLHIGKLGESYENLKVSRCKCRNEENVHMYMYMYIIVYETCEFNAGCFMDSFRM